MALVLADRVQETCTSPGTGAVTLLGAVTGYQAFSTGVGNGNTCYYCIADQGGANWEVGIGTYASSGNTLTRTSPISGSASTPVNFSSGTQNVFVTYPAEKSVNLDASGNVSALGTITSGTWNGATLPVGYGGTGVTTSTGTGDNVLSTNPVLTTPNLGTPSAVNLTNATALPLTTGVSGVLPTANGGTNLSSFTSGGVVYASSTSALTTGSELTFNGTTLNFGGTAQRITGDFSNATVANRVAFQTSTVNGNTFVNAIPNGTGTSSGFVTYNSSDTANASFFTHQVVGTTEARINSNITGTGTYLPMTFFTGGSERVRITTSGGVAFGGSTNYGSTGQVLTSNGDAAPSWQTSSSASKSQAIAYSLLFGL